MGTRADFYVGRGKNAEWLGSIAWDGYPEAPGHVSDYHILDCHTEELYRSTVAKMFADLDHGTTADQGWPWPWDDSGTTDFAYAFDDDTVWASWFGGLWYNPLTEKFPERHGPKVEFPDMASQKHVILGKHSGLIIAVVEDI